MRGAGAEQREWSAQRAQGKSAKKHGVWRRWKSVGQVVHSGGEEA